MYEYRVAEVDRVVDGDTVDLVLDLGFSLFKKERCRVAGIDSPESRTRDLKEKKYGIEAKNALMRMLSQKRNFIVRTEKDGKYGRCLAWIYAEGDKKSINESMVDLGFAWRYDGGTKLTGDERFAELDKRRSAALSIIKELTE